MDSQPSPAGSRAYSLSEFRKAFGGISEATLHRYLAAGRVKSIKLAGRRVIPASEVARLVDGVAA